MPTRPSFLFLVPSPPPTHCASAGQEQSDRSASGRRRNHAPRFDDGRLELIFLQPGGLVGFVRYQIPDARYSKETVDHSKWLPARSYPSPNKRHEPWNIMIHTVHRQTCSTSHFACWDRDARLSTQSSPSITDPPFPPTPKESR